ncbi:hypothetical protein ABPG75_004850 [Micractinium tetrahymenae]
MPPRRQRTGRAVSAHGPSGPPLTDLLPEDLLLRCLELLSQEDRFRAAAPVSKRWNRLCHAPPLLRSIEFDAGGASEEGDQRTQPRLQALLHLLNKHAGSVRSLDIAVYNTVDREAVSALAERCMWPVAAAAQLEELDFAIPCSPDLGWLPSLAALRSMSVGCLFMGAVTLPAGMSKLTALADAELNGGPVDLSGLAALSGLQALELVDTDLAQGPLPSSLTSRLCQLVLRDAGPLPAELASMTQLQRLALSATIIHDRRGELAQLEAALGCLQQLTTLNVASRGLRRVPPGITSLSRLERMCLDNAHGEIAGLGTGPPTPPLHLPPGRWLSSLRWLGLPWSSLQDAAGVLRAWAHSLEYLCSTDTPRWRPRSTAQWRALWEGLLCRHPPLRCFAFQSEPGLEAPVALADALLILQHRRPGLYVRRLQEHAFSHLRGELMQAAALPAREAPADFDWLDASEQDTFAELVAFFEGQGGGSGDEEASSEEEGSSEDDDEGSEDESDSSEED